MRCMWLTENTVTGDAMDAVEAWVVMLRWRNTSTG